MADKYRKIYNHQFSAFYQSLCFSSSRQLCATMWALGCSDQNELHFSDRIRAATSTIMVSGDAHSKPFSARNVTSHQVIKPLALMEKSGQHLDKKFIILKLIIS